MVTTQFFAMKIMRYMELHGISRGLPNVMIEVRNDLLTTLEDVQAIASELLAMLRPALAAVPVEAADA